MRRMIVLLLTAAAATTTPAQSREPDPMSSAECVEARAELDKALSEPATTRTARLARARRQATAACLGAESGNRQRSGAPQPPQSVPAPANAARPAPAPSPAIEAPQPPLAMPRPGVITTCDPAGCWDSEGRRLNNMGPLLLGPRGLCTLVGGLLNCP